MVAVLRFDLSDHDDAMDYARANAATDLCATLWDMDEQLRTLIKNEGKAELQEARDLLHTLMRENGIDLERLYS